MVDRLGTTGKLYSYQFGVNTTWQLEGSVALLGLSGTQTIAGASNNLNKVTVDGNTLFIAESNGIAVYSQLERQYHRSGDPDHLHVYG
jgi:hypothetical protein